MDSGEEVVLAVAQNVVAHSDTRRDEFDNAAFYEFLGEFGVFKLFAYCYTLTGTHKLGKVCVEGVMREAGQLYILRRTVCPTRKCYAEYFGSGYRIVGKSFVEISYAEKQYGVGMFLLHLGILLHERSFDNFFCHFREGMIISFRRKRVCAGAPLWQSLYKRGPRQRQE